MNGKNIQTLIIGDMEYKQAKEIAIQVYKKIEPFTTKCDIVGSLRREKPYVHDMEIICEPRTVEMTDLFGEVLGIKRNPGFVQTVRELGLILKGKITDGRYVQIALPEGINLDLFMPQSSDYYRQLAIRTGSSEYSHQIIAKGWLKAGWCGTENGLRRIQQCYQINIGGDKKKWICNAGNPILPPVFNSELDFFKFIKVPWIEPNKR